MSTLNAMPLDPPAPGSPADRILNATRAILAEAGADAISTRAVARRAGVNQAMLNYYFGSKDRLLDALLAREIVAVVADVFGSLTADDSPQLFVQFPLRLLDNLRGDPVRRQLLRLVLATQPERLRRVIRELGPRGVLGSSQRLRELVAGAQARGELAEVDGRSILLFLIASAYGLILMETVAEEVVGFSLRDDRDWQQHREALAALLSRGILATGRSES
jgi:TetR/AcrR family transcriptional regulator